MAKQKASRPQSYADLDEEVEVKPSTELTPDEYLRINNQNMSVHLFFGPRNEDARDFADNLENIGYTVSEHQLRQVENKEERTKILKTIWEDTRGKDGLILVLSGAVIASKDLEEIWSWFTSKNCPALKNKPKIFIFQVCARKTPADSLKRLSYAYTVEFDTPCEADILIVYERLSSVGDESSLIPNLTTNLGNYGIREDITSLATYYNDSDSENSDKEEGDKETSSRNEGSPPMKHFLISTMTRKFFFVPAKHRGNHHSIMETHEKITETIESLKVVAETYQPSDDSQKSGSKIMSTIKKTLSFRNKTPNVSPKAKKSRSQQEKSIKEEVMNKAVAKNENKTIHISNTKELDNKIKSDKVSISNRIDEVASTSHVNDPNNQTSERLLKKKHLALPDGSTSWHGIDPPPSLIKNGKKSTENTNKTKRESAIQIGSSKESIKSNKSPKQKPPFRLF